jgi:hypothetical protein
MVLTAYFVLSPVIGFLATVAPKKLASQELDASAAASGPHDFAVRFSIVRLVPRNRTPDAAASTASPAQRS